MAQNTDSHFAMSGGIRMKDKFLKAAIGVFFILTVILLAISVGSIQAQDRPVIHIDPITHRFPPVFEGETLSHDFTVSNRGSADLEIKEVTHQ
jgi:hypothetical protein